MKVSTVYVRFYKAFNFNYLRKHRPGSEPDPWDLYQGHFYPYVKVELDPEVTCVVGANESGKSQLLDAIEHVLGDRQPDPADFCRYSEFFTVGTRLRTPHFGLRLCDLNEADHAAMSDLSGTPIDSSVSDVRIFLEDPDQLRLFVGQSVDSIDVPLTDSALRALPQSFRIDPTRPIPDSAPLDYLVARANGTTVPIQGRQERWSLIDPLISRLSAIRSALLSNPQNPGSLASLLPGDHDVKTLGDEEIESRRAQFDLAYELIVTVGGVAPSTFGRLHEALRSENEGFVNALKASINRQLSEALNLKRWWTQDEEFDLQIDVRDFDIVFTISDRTASEYSFAERSSGLKYFLSYLVQYLAHLAHGQSAELLLMDEPDAFLSNQGQQDLLRLFQDFVSRGDDSSSRQVVFVTHSPFLIDKNRADRVRVLDKGAQDEGTRVVQDAGRNHFEPLRSAFGSFVGETTFIGNCNLMLEGVADQVYIAGVSSALLRRGVSSAERMDLNEFTLVPAGGAQHIPYMTFLARGRDADQPAVIVLLDNDPSGNDAKVALERGGPHGKQVLDPAYVLVISNESLPGIESVRTGGPQEIEDLVPPSIVVRACARYASEVGIAEDPLPTAEQVAKNATKANGLFDGASVALQASGSSLRLDKVALARNVVQVLDTADDPDAETARRNFMVLFTRLGELQRRAVHERARIDVGKRVDRVISSFLADRKMSSTKSDLKILLEKIEVLLDTTRESEEIRKRIRILRTENALTTDLSDLVEDYEGLRKSLAGMKYAGLHASQDKAD